MTNFEARAASGHGGICPLKTREISIRSSHRSQIKFMQLSRENRETSDRRSRYNHSQHNEPALSIAVQKASIATGCPGIRDAFSSNSSREGSWETVPGRFTRRWLSIPGRVTLARVSNGGLLPAGLAGDRQVVILEGRSRPSLILPCHVSANPPASSALASASSRSGGARPSSRPMTSSCAVYPAREEHAHPDQLNAWSCPDDRRSAGR